MPADIRDRFELDAVEEVQFRQRLGREKAVEGGLISDRLPGGGVLPKPTQPLHFGIDLAKPSDYILRTMPQWEEPPVHMDLVCLDSTVTVDGAALVEAGFLSALRDAEVIAAAARYGNPIELLETAF